MGPVLFGTFSKKNCPQSEKSRRNFKMSKKICVILIILIMGVVSLTTGVYAASKVTASKATKSVSAENTNTENAVNEVQTTSVPATSNEVMASTTENVTGTQGSSNDDKTSNSSSGLGLIAAALAIGLSAIGSGIAVAVVASSAVGAISENPSLLGKTVIFAGLAEGIAIYGLIIAIMIISKV